MRTILVTGPGGAGRTTVAAATALSAAREGRERVLFLTGDRDVADWFTPGEGGPAVRRIDSGAHFRAELLAVQERCAAALDLLGAAPLAEEELTELPGSDRFALLRALRDAATGGDGGTGGTGRDSGDSENGGASGNGGDGVTGGEGPWDLVVVDLPPLPDAIAVLALPEQLRRYLRRLLPAERQTARALRPMLAQFAGVPMPAAWLYETAARWDADLASVQALIESPATTLRLVAEPGPAAAHALRTARAGLALHRLAPGTVVANKLLPTTSPDPWLAALAAQQQAHLKELYAELGDVHELPHLGRAPRSAGDLAPLEPPAPTAAPAPAPAPEWTVEDRRDEDGVLVWRIPLPGAAKRDLSLVRRGDELVLTVGPFRRIVPLPSALRRCTVSGAGLADGVLSVRFTPDPDMWPRTR
ncbi:ArsA-related P-loop ATPase [Streptomyces ficellus]|uniref:ArsA-related P-loop ATPase n=1 Tax=Streptomyces ficellus TaxID=1977088 RepID=A0ABT7Z8X1_9ACTN|nr:ArsA-related P-loop ATPase [Streptomyces ficellus]MDN3295496.1 ArsA-related P-loop ATPase [Streptomyces ficellus]